MSSVAATNATISPDGLVRFEYDGVVRAQAGSEIPAAVVVGKLTNEQLESIEAAKISGQLTNEQLKEIAAAKITGQLTNAQLESIAAAKITGAITETQIGPEAISTPKLKAGAVTTAKIEAGAITTATLAAGAVTATILAAGAVTTAKLAAGAVTAEAIAALAVTTEKLSAGAVSTAKLAAGAVTAATIAAAAITTEKLAAGAVTAEKLTVATLSAISANLGTVTAGTIEGPTIRTATTGARVLLDSTGLRAFNAGGEEVLDFSTATGNLAIKGEIKAGSSVPASTVTGQLTNEQLKEIAAAKLTGTITETQIGAEAVSTPKLKAGSITTAKLAAAAVTAEKVSVATLSALSANLGTVTAGTLKSVTIESGDLILPEYTAGAEEGAPFIEWGGGAERIVGAKRGEVRTIEIRANDISSGAGEVLLDAHGENASIVGRFAARARLIVESKEASTVKLAVRAKNGLEAFTERVLLNSAGQSDFLQLATTAEHKVVFGSTVLSFSASKFTPEVKVTHGLGKTPVHVFVTSENAEITAGARGYTETQFTLQAGDWLEAITGNRTIHWMAIG